MSQTKTNDHQLRQILRKLTGDVTVMSPELKTIQEVLGHLATSGAMCLPFAAEEVFVIYDRTPFLGQLMNPRRPRRGASAPRPAKRGRSVRSGAASRPRVGAAALAARPRYCRGDNARAAPAKGVGPDRAACTTRATVCRVCGVGRPAGQGDNRIG